MEKIVLSLLLLLSIISISTAIEPTGLNHRARAKAFVVAECRGTRYVKLCIRCLTPFVHSTPQTPEQLAQIALKVSLVRARYARAYMSKLVYEMRRKKAKEYQAVKDCLDQISDGVNQLTNSFKEIRRMSIDSENYFSWHESNAQTWMSTAHTDALTCLDGFPGHAMGSKAKATIRAKAVNVAEVTSNALAFFNRFVARHRASQAKKP